MSAQRESRRVRRDDGTHCRTAPRRWRQPGRVEAGTTFTSTKDLAAALRRAEAAHGEHERRNGGQRDENWPEWYAQYLVREQTGEALLL